MSMDYSEFERLLGAEPRSQDPAFLRARDSSPEFQAAAADAERFEQRLEQALSVPLPADFFQELHAIPRSEAHPAGGQGSSGAMSRFALAASLVIAIGAAGLTWKMRSGWDSVEDYVVDHYRHDGIEVLARADENLATDVTGFLAEFGIAASPALARVIHVIKKCPTPDGKGIHMVLDTGRGLVTVIYMPRTAVIDGEKLAFDDSEAVLVALRSGSAVIIGTESQRVSELRTLVQESILPVGENT